MKSIFKKIIVTILEWEAKLVLRKYKPHIIAVTGSVGKTATKDAIFAVLSGQKHVRKSDKSFNSEIGLPLTILGVPNAWSNPLRWLQNILDGLFLICVPAQYPEWLVLEVGADKPGDISSLASWLPVDVAVITRLPDVPVHVEFFSSPQAVVEEKASLIQALKPTGVLVAFADDAKVDLLRMLAEEKGVRVVTFGLTKTADVCGSNFEPLFVAHNAWPSGMKALITSDGVGVPVEVHGVFGAHSLLSIVAAAAVGRVLGRTVEDIARGVTKYEPPKGRMRLIPGLKGSLIIDDTYNSSPAAVEAALATLAMMSSPRGTVLTGGNPLQQQSAIRRIAVLGDMLELGKYSVEEHTKIGTLAATQVDLLVTVGFRARDIAEGAIDGGLSESCVLQYEDSERAGEELQAMLTEHDVVLVKGSQSIRTEKIVERLLLEPERAREFLVRQDVDWKRR